MRTPYQIYKEEVPNGLISSFNALPLEESLRYRMLAAEEGLTSHVIYLEENPLDVPRYAFSAIHTAAGFATAIVSLFPIMSRSSSDKKICFDFLLLRRLLVALGNTDIANTVDLLGEQQSREGLSLRELSTLESLLQEQEQKMRHKLKEEGRQIEMLRTAAPLAVTKMRSSSSTVKLGLTGSQERDAGLSSQEITCLHLLVDSSSSSTQELPKGKEARVVNMVEDTVMKEGGTAIKASKRPRKDKSAEKSHSTTSEEPGMGKRMKVQREGGDNEKNEEEKKLKSSTTVNTRSLLGTEGTTLAKCGRLRALSSQEKRIAAAIQQLLELLAHVYATKCNELVIIFDFLSQKVKELEKMVASAQQQQQQQQQASSVQKEHARALSTSFPSAGSNSASGQKPLALPLGSVNPFLDLNFGNVLSAIAASNRTFRADEECQLEFDEDLLHPIAYSLVKELNRLEGFSTSPFPEPSREEKEKKQALRAAAKRKREEARQKAEEKLRQKEAQAVEQARQLDQIRKLIGSTEDDVVEEDISERQTLPYIHYDELPLGNSILFEKALFVWCMLTSIPKSLQLSKMPFSTFLQGLQEESEGDNALMKEVVQQMLNVGKEQIRSPVSSLRGKTWFSGLVAFVEEASGNKKKPVQVEKIVSSSSSSDEDLEEEEEEEGQEEKNGSHDANGAKEQKKEEETIPLPPPPKTFEDEIRETIEDLKAMHSRASWGNASLSHRLNLLQFCVSELLSNDKVKEEADAVQRDADEVATAMEKGMREIRDEGEKELRSIWKRTTLGGNKRKKVGAVESEGVVEEEANKVKKGTETEEDDVQQIFDTLRTKHSTLYFTWIKKQDDELVGCIIDPIGMDRFRRLYWRFPLDRQHIYVQTTADTLPNPPPLVPKPKNFSLLYPGSPRLLLDDDEESAPSRDGASCGEEGHTFEPPQTTWGVIPTHYLESFCKGLCVGGKHEGSLRRTLLALAPHLQKSNGGTNSVRTRSRSQMFGYANQLNPRSFFF